MRIFHTNDLHQARFTAPGSISVTEVFRYPALPNAGQDLNLGFRVEQRDRVILHHAFQLFNVGHDTEYGVPDRPAVDYRARNNRGLSIGDVVAIDDRFYQVAPVGWIQLDTPPTEDPTGHEPGSTPYDPDDTPQRTTAVVGLDVRVSIEAWQRAHGTNPRTALPGHVARKARLTPHLILMADAPGHSGAVTVAGSKPVLTFHDALTMRVVLAVTVPIRWWQVVTGVDPADGIGPYLATELVASTYVPDASGIWDPGYNVVSAVARYRAAMLAFRHAYFTSGGAEDEVRPWERQDEAIRAELTKAGRWPLATALRTEHERLTVVYEEERRAYPDKAGLAIWRSRAHAATAEVDRLVTRTAP